MTPRLVDTPVLETERLTLRAIGPQDIDRAVAYLQTERTYYMGGPFSEHRAWGHCAQLIGHWVLRGYGLFALCLKGSDEAIGDVVLNMPGIYPETEIGWGIWSPEYEGKGYAFEAALAVRAYARDTLGWTSAVSYIDPGNARSIALATRMGCALDTTATLPDLPGWDDALVYRHPMQTKEPAA